MSPIQSAQRVSQVDASDNFVFQRSLLAYHHAAQMVSGHVLEIGTGSGYGIEALSHKVSTYTTIDKFDCRAEIFNLPNVEFHRMKVPPMPSIASSSMDFVISFQVIEHISDDFGLLSEVYRVLKPGGKFIVTTPNRLMSLTRNPWHVREYTPCQFKNLLRVKFASVESMGIFGNERVMAYYERNRLAVANLRRFDIFRLMDWAPRWMLRLPYDLANRLNRRRLLASNRSLASSISMSDYHLSQVDDHCFDLFFVATK